METYLAVPEIKAKFDSEWILVSEPQTNDNLEVQAGKVIFHSKDRDEVYREAIKHHLKHFALLYTGTMAKDMAIVL